MDRSVWTLITISKNLQIHRQYWIPSTKTRNRTQPRHWNLYKIIWKLENFSVFFNNAKVIDETNNKNETDPHLVRDFCGRAFLSKPYGYFLSAPSPMDVAQRLQINVYHHISER